jgi:hypothetical protein
VGLANLGSELETCVRSRVRLVGVTISFEKNFYRLPFTPPLWFAILVLQFFVFLRYRHKICDSASCRELEAVIFGAYLHFRVLIMSPKFRLKTPCGLGDPSIGNLRLFLEFLGCADSHLEDRPRGHCGLSARCWRAWLFFVFMRVLECLSFDPFCWWIFGA